MKGWVYVITNKAMPDLIKVGFSMKDPEIRASELNHTGSPHPYIVDYELLVEDPRNIEQTVHGKLRNYREGKEWFRCSVEEAISAIKIVVGLNFHVENFKRADREKVQLIIEKRKSEEDARLEKERIRKNHEDYINARRKEIISSYEPILKSKIPEINFWVCFAGSFIVIVSAMYFAIPKMGDTTRTIISTVIALITTPFVKDYFIEKAKNTIEYQATLSERDSKISELDLIKYSKNKDPRTAISVCICGQRNRVTEKLGAIQHRDSYKCGRCGKPIVNPFFSSLN